MRPPCLPLRMSSIMMFLIKFEGPSLIGCDSGDVSVDSVSNATFLIFSVTKTLSEISVQFTRDVGQGHLAKGEASKLRDALVRMIVGSLQAATTKVLDHLGASSRHRRFLLQLEPFHRNEGPRDLRNY